MKRSFLAAAGALAVTALLSGLAVSNAGAAGSFGDVQVFNPDGGITGSDGLKIILGGGQLQAYRTDGQGEIYAPNRYPGDRNSGLANQIVLAVGDSVDGGTAFVALTLTRKTNAASNVAVVAWDAVTTTSANTVTSTLTGEADGLTYTVVVTTTYTPPDDRMKFDYEVIVPAGNTKPVRLYHLLDSYLGGNDAGPGFFTDPVECSGGGLSGAVVGVDRATDDRVQAFQFVSGQPWAGYMSANYNDVVFGGNRKTNIATGGAGDHYGPGFMNDLSEQIITDPTNDNGFGVNWNFGATPGTYNSSNKLIFSAVSVDPCADAEAVSVTNPDPTEVPDAIIDPDVIPDPVPDPLKPEETTEPTTPPTTTPTTPPTTTPTTPPTTEVLVPSYTG